ncbi:MAG: hypothetical protein MRJ93_10220 [Nitrososphaeraceae archaeon]|nr:hypothetical protein [Nitrososphaeraceae archaeon]
MKNNYLILFSLFSTLSILLVAVASFTMSVYAQEDGNTTDADIPKFFAIQHAQSGSISEINETAYSLELNDVSDKTILFSDRPDRIVKTEITKNFIGNWSTGVDSFADDAPNAVLVVDKIEAQQDTAIVELFNPIYDLDKNSLQYQVTPDNVTSIDLVGEFGQATLLIDPGGQSGPGT